MRLESRAGASLHLSIAGYQFPDLPGGRLLFDHDANWLMVRGEVNDGERAWTFRDPCLLTTEARRLVAWLEARADGRPEDETADFMEPNLAFRQLSSPGAQLVVRVIFRLESRPPWASNITDGDWDSAYLDFDVSHDDLRVAANDLRSELRNYPER